MHLHTINIFLLGHIIKSKSLKLYKNIDDEFLYNKQIEYYHEYNLKVSAKTPFIEEDNSTKMK